MSGNALKTPFATNMNRFASKKINDGAQLDGKEFPAAVVSYAGGSMVAAFQVQGYGALPNVEVGVVGSRYFRAPYQAGDTGVLRAADAVLGGITGLGTGTAGTALPANLGGLLFEPASSTTWPPMTDPNAAEVAGPNGFVCKNFAGTCSIIGNSSGLTLTFGAHSIVIDSTGVTIDGKPFLPHEHSGGTIGGNTGPVL